MKRFAIIVCMFALSQNVFASQIIPPRMVVKWLIQAIQEGRSDSVTCYFVFDPEKHRGLAILSREDQLQLLKDLPVDKLTFDKDEYAVDIGKRFIVKLLSPVKLDFEIEQVELKGDFGPSCKYNIIAIRKTVQPDSKGLSSPSISPP